MEEKRSVTKLSVSVFIKMIRSRWLDDAVGSGPSRLDG